MFVATTSLTRSGVESCVDFLESVRASVVWLPLPVELCMGSFVDLGALEWYLEPLVSLYHAYRGRWRCYGSVEELKRRGWAAAELAALVVKARAFGKVELSEWDALFGVGGRWEVPMPAFDFGVSPGGDVVVCGVYPPSPIETAWGAWGRLDRGRRVELAWWVVRHVSYIVESRDLDEAYAKTVEAGWGSAFWRLLSYV